MHTLHLHKHYHTWIFGRAILGARKRCAFRVEEGCSLMGQKVASQQRAVAKKSAKQQGVTHHEPTNPMMREQAESLRMENCRVTTSYPTTTNQLGLVSWLKVNHQ